MRAYALLAAAVAALLPGAALADTLIDNVNGISIDRDGKVTPFAGMVIDDQGRITQLLGRRDKPPEKIDYRQDGRGRTVIPGFVDAHVDVMELGLASLSLDLSGTASLQEARARLAAYAEAAPDRPWIVGRGWDAARWGTGLLPAAADVDALVPDRPVWLVSADGEAGWANTAALAAAGISAASADPAGGRIERRPGSRQPTGVLVGTAMALVEDRVPAPRAEDRDLAFRNAQRALLARGVTAVADMGTSIEDWMTYRRAGDDGRLQLRFMAYADAVQSMLLIGGTGPTRWLYGDRLRLNGAYFRLDGTLGSHGALLGAPYADAPAQSGLQRLNGTQLRNLMSRAAMDGYQVAIGATGDAAVTEALDAIAELSRDYNGDRRWRVEGADVASPSDHARFGALGVIASMRPGAVSDDWRSFDAKVGPDRLVGVHAWRSLLQAGAGLVFGSGAPAAPADATAGLAVAISRSDAAGQPFGGWMPGETLSREQALAAYTAGAAHAGFAEGRFGSLKVGERADFVVLDGDPLLANPAEMRAIRVLETWIDGRKVFEAAAQGTDAPGR